MRARSCRRTSPRGFARGRGRCRGSSRVGAERGAGLHGGGCTRRRRRITRRASAPDRVLRRGDVLHAPAAQRRAFGPILAPAVRAEVARVIAGRRGDVRARGTGTASGRVRAAAHVRLAPGATHGGRPRCVIHHVNGLLVRVRHREAAPGWSAACRAVLADPPSWESCSCRAHEPRITRAQIFRHERTIRGRRVRGVTRLRTRLVSRRLRVRPRAEGEGSARGRCEARRGRGGRRRETAGTIPVPVRRRAPSLGRTGGPGRPGGPGGPGRGDSIPRVRARSARGRCPRRRVPRVRGVARRRHRSSGRSRGGRTGNAGARWSAAVRVRGRAHGHGRRAHDGRRRAHRRGGARAPGTREASRREGDRGTRRARAQGRARARGWRGAGDHGDGGPSARGAPFASGGGACPLKAPGAPGAPGRGRLPRVPRDSHARIWAVGGATGPPTPAGGAPGTPSGRAPGGGATCVDGTPTVMGGRVCGCIAGGGPAPGIIGRGTFWAAGRARPRAEAGPLGSREAGKGVVGRQAGVLGGSRSRRKTGPGRARGPNASRSSLGAHPRRENQHRPSTKPRRGRDPKIADGERAHRSASSAGRGGGAGARAPRPGLHRVSSRASRRAREQVGPRPGRRLEAEQGRILSPARGRSFATGKFLVDSRPRVRSSLADDDGCISTLDCR